MNIPRWLPALAALCLCGPALPAGERPNFLIIMVDDLGYSDIGCYGSEIETPNLDELAANGLRFTQFYNTAKCHSSRISLLTGRYALQAGDTSLKRATTSAEVLGKAGYFTAMSGKWHLDRQPTDFGFHRYFGHLSGACNYYRGDKTFRLNGEPWRVPEKGFYTTVAKVDHALSFLGEAREAGKPWYLYLAFNAPHAPLQPLREDYEKYEGRYDAGWDSVRDARLQKQRELGLFGKDVEPSPRPGHIPAWEELPRDRRDWEIRRMTALAGMIDRVDQELGRLFDDLRRAGEMDDTLILFVSDNGACPYDRRSPKMDREPYEADVTWSDSTGWAWARNAPFRFYKQNQFEGGACTPGIVHWPNGLGHAKGATTTQPAHLIDVLPTMAELAGVELPKTWPGRNLEPVAGISLVNHLKGEKMGSRPPIHLLFAGDRGLRDGDWKLVSFRSAPWELYNIKEDRTELHDIAAAHPDIVRRMSRQWHDMTTNVLKAPSKANTPVRTERTPHLHPEWTAFGQPLGEIGKATSGKAKGKPAAKRPPIRARKDTRMKVKKNELHLECTGTDSGIAIDRMTGIRQTGPYLLTFRLKSNAGTSGEVYFTTAETTKLPNGDHLEFPVETGDGWQEHQIELKTNGTIFALRLDPGNQPGSAIIADLALKDMKGTVLKSWPE